MEPPRRKVRPQLRREVRTRDLNSELFHRELTANTMKEKKQGQNSEKTTSLVLTKWKCILLFNYQYALFNLNLRL